MEDNFAKITSAVYRLLDFFPDSDPLKNKAKEKALEILANSRLVFDNQGWLSLKKYLSPERQKVTEQLLDDIEILESYLKIGKHQGWVSDINFLIVVKEYDNIKNQIDIKKIVTNPIPAPAQKQDAQINKSLQIIPEPEKKVSQLVLQKPIGQNKYSVRQEKILKILTKNEKKQVADIIKELPDVTKRTIRRDLDDLLKRGEIVRVGDYNQVSYQIK